MSTFWLNGRKERVPLSEMQCQSFSWSLPSMGGIGARGGGVGGGDGGGVSTSILEQFRSAAPSLDSVRGKSFSESTQSMGGGPPIGDLVKGEHFTAR